MKSLLQILLSLALINITTAQRGRGFASRGNDDGLLRTVGRGRDRFDRTAFLARLSERIGNPSRNRGRLSTRPTTPAVTSPPVDGGENQNRPVVIRQNERAEIRRVKSFIERLVNRENEWLPRFVQIAFHDCFEGCDGCINLKDPQNLGVKVTVDKVDEIRQQVAGNWTRADLFALCGVVASEVAISLRAASPSISIDYSRGRRDCNDFNNPPLRNLPDGDTTDAIGILKSQFRLTDNEGIALMGSHSIGKTHQQFSGFDEHGWDLTQDVLDHGYFLELNNETEWKPSRVDNEKRKTFQWKINVRGTTVTMLHMDMSMMLNYTLNSNKAPSCSNFSACPRTKHLATIQRFAGNVESFLNTYKRAFEKMISKLP